MVRAAAVAASLLLVTAACGTKPSTGDNPAGGSGSIGALTLTEGTLLVSDGTNVVIIGDQKVTFPTTVTDAAWSPDGSRIAFVDGDGNIATARPDGSGLVVLTKTDGGVARSRPSWSRAWLFYAEKKADGTSALKSVPTNGCSAEGQPSTGEDWSMDTGDGTSYVDLAPSAAQRESPSSVMFEHDEPGGPEIWINDTNQRTPHTAKVVDGSEPTLRADAAKFAYVGRNGQIFVRDLKSETPVQISFGADQPTRLTWMPDGQHVAYKTPGGVESVGISPGNGSNPATRLSATIGVPTFLPSTKDSVNRVTGADPIGLAVAASQARWPAVASFVYAQGYHGAWNVALATAEQAGIPQGLSGPLLLTAGDALDPRTKAELQRIFGVLQRGTAEYAKPEVLVIGSAISANVVSTLEGMGFKVTRASATSAVAPAAAAAQCGWAGVANLTAQTLVVVDPSSATNDLIATTLAAPVLRIDPKAALTDQVRTYLAKSSPSLNQVLIVDPTNAISADLEKEIGTILSGPLGYTTGTNPTVPPLS